MSLRILLSALFVLAALHQAAGETAGPAYFGPDTPIERLRLTYRGDPKRPVAMNMTLILPEGTGPFPLVVLNHGSSLKKSENDLKGFDRHLLIYYFLGRGYAVALPFMRGYGGSSGKLTHPNTCRLDAMAQDNAQDIMAAVDHLAKFPRVDTSRVIMVGGSLGGWNALAVGSLNDPRVKVIVNFYGGIRYSGCHAGDEALRQGARQFGRTSRTPSIWFYGDNDQIFPKPVFEAMYRAYVDEGGQAERVAYGFFGADSHLLLSDPDAARVYAPRLEAFLSQRGLPTRITHPQYVPLPPPPATHYAAIEDVDAVPFLDAKNRDAYRAFLKAPLPRAFFIIGHKGSIALDKGYDPLARGYKICRENGLECWLYAVNDTVVWSDPRPRLPATTFAHYDDASAIPYIDGKGRAGYEAFLKLPRPKAFVIAPNGAWMLASGERDAVGVAMERCSRGQSGCKPYAVDGSVVWTEKASTLH